jgi:hypothetical protein
VEEKDDDVDVYVYVDGQGRVSGAGGRVSDPGRGLVLSKARATGGATELPASDYPTINRFAMTEPAQPP